MYEGIQHSTNEFQSSVANIKGDSCHSLLFCSNYMGHTKKDMQPKNSYTHQEILWLNVPMYNGSLVKVIQCWGEVSHHGAGILLSVAGGTGDGIKQVTTLQVQCNERLSLIRVRFSYINDMRMPATKLTVRDTPTSGPAWTWQWEQLNTGL